MAKEIRTVSITEVENYKKMAELARGTHLWSSLWMMSNYKSPAGRWVFSSWGLPIIYTTPDRWYLKDIKGDIWLYRYSAGQDEDRYLLGQLARKFFNVD